MRQADLFDFASGPRPRQDEVDDEDEAEGLPVHQWGKRCVRCGRRLGGGGLWVSGWGLCCWDCYHKPMGRRDGRGDASRVAAAERNCRGKAYKRRR